MHELSVCQALIRQAELVAQRHGAHGVRTVTLHLGPLAGVEAALLARAFCVARGGTLLAEADLVIELRPVRVRCARCGAETEVPVNRLLCGACGDPHTQLLSGDDLLLASLQLVGATDSGPSALNNEEAVHV
jgi:hydrogenase nickel incorporation protein HypA/HybF